MLVKFSGFGLKSMLVLEAHYLGFSRYQDHLLLILQVKLCPVVTLKRLIGNNLRLLIVMLLRT